MDFTLSHSVEQQQQQQQQQPKQHTALSHSKSAVLNKLQQNEDHLRKLPCNLSDTSPQWPSPYRPWDLWTVLEDRNSLRTQPRARPHQNRDIMLSREKLDTAHYQHVVPTPSAVRVPPGEPGGSPQLREHSKIHLPIVPRKFPNLL